MHVPATSSSGVKPSGRRGDAGRSAGVECAAHCDHFRNHNEPCRARRQRDSAGWLTCSHYEPSRPNARVIGSAPHSMLVSLETIATRCRVRCTRALGRTTGEKQTIRRNGRVERADSASRPTRRDDAASTAMDERAVEPRSVKRSPDPTFTDPHARRMPHARSRSALHPPEDTQ